MRIQLVSRHLEVHPALREHVERRFSSLSRHYDRDSCRLHVEIDHVQGGSRHPQFEVHAQLSVPGRLLVAHGRAFDAYAAVDAAEAMLLREMDRWRERLADHGARAMR